MRRLASRSIPLALAALLALAAPPSRALPEAAAAGKGEAPYPPSDLITDVRFDWSTRRLLAPGSDNWPVTWAADGGLYTSWGDGGGFGQGASGRAYVSLGVGRLSGSDAGSLSGRNLIGGLDPSVAGCFQRRDPFPADEKGASPCRGRGLGGKARGIMALDNQLHLWVTPGSLTTGYRFARILKAAIGTNAWTAAPWDLERDETPALIFPSFVQAGRNHADLPGGFVYTYAARYAPAGNANSGLLSVQRGPGGGQVFLLRSPRSNLLAPPEYSAGDGRWTASGREAGPVFADPNGAGPRVSGSYVRQLGRFILMSGHGREYASQLGMFEAPDPWGPWRTVFYGTLGADVPGLPETAFFYGFLPNSFSADGRSFTFLFTGVGALDGLTAVDGTFELSGR